MMRSMATPRTVVRYIGGPLDGQGLDATDWTDDTIRTGTYEIVDGWTDRAAYDPDPDGDPLRWHYRGPIPH